MFLEFVHPSLCIYGLPCTALQTCNSHLIVQQDCFMCRFEICYSCGRLLVPSPITTRESVLFHLRLSAVIWHTCRQFTHVCFPSNPLVKREQILLISTKATPLCQSGCLSEAKLILSISRTTKTRRHSLVYEVQGEIGRGFWEIASLMKKQYYCHE